MSKILDRLRSVLADRYVVQREIDGKPENVLLRRRHAVVTDFGVAKALSEATSRHRITTSGVSLGTPAYMAPEPITERRPAVPAARGEVVSWSSDRPAE